MVNLLCIRRLLVKMMTTAMMRTCPRLRMPNEAPHAVPDTQQALLYSAGQCMPCWVPADPDHRHMHGLPVILLIRIMCSSAVWEGALKTGGRELLLEQITLVHCKHQCSVMVAIAWTHNVLQPQDTGGSARHEEVQ